MPYSIDFRRQVLLVRERDNLTIAEVAARFGVGVASVVRWLKKIEPQPGRNKPATRIDRIALARDVRMYPDAYSPDLNPVEHKWAHAKAVRKQRYCSIDALFINDAL